MNIDVNNFNFVWYQPTYHDNNGQSIHTERLHLNLKALNDISQFYLVSEIQKCVVIADSPHLKSSYSNTPEGMSVTKLRNLIWKVAEHLGVQVVMGLKYIHLGEMMVTLRNSGTLGRGMNKMLLKMPL